MVLCKKAKRNVQTAVETLYIFMVHVATGFMFGVRNDSIKAIIIFMLAKWYDLMLKSCFISYGVHCTGQRQTLVTNIIAAVEQLMQ